jgi:hypothetical protein
MNEVDKEQSDTRGPLQQAQQPQPPALHDNEGIPPANILPNNTRNTAVPLAENASSAEMSAFDDARFTADVIKLYEAVLKEPIPADMLNLVDKLGKQERQ